MDQDHPLANLASSSSTDQGAPVVLAQDTGQQNTNNEAAKLPILSQDAENNILRKTFAHRNPNRYKLTPTRRQLEATAAASNTTTNGAVEKKDDKGETNVSNQEKPCSLEMAMPAKFSYDAAQCRCVPRARSVITQYFRCSTCHRPQHKACMLKTNENSEPQFKLREYRLCNPCLQRDILRRTGRRTLSPIPNPTEETASPNTTEPQPYSTSQATNSPPEGTMPPARRPHTESPLFLTPDLSPAQPPRPASPHVSPTNSLNAVVNTAFALDPDILGHPSLEFDSSDPAEAYIRSMVWKRYCTLPSHHNTPRVVTEWTRAVDIMGCIRPLHNAPDDWVDSMGQSFENLLGPHTHRILSRMAKDEMQGWELQFWEEMYRLAVFTKYHICSRERGMDIGLMAELIGLEFKGTLWKGPSTGPPAKKGYA